jgi:hypothetical protein
MLMHVRDACVQCAVLRCAQVRLFGVCTNGADLAGPAVVLSQTTRAVLELILNASSDALIIPRIPMMAGPSFPLAVMMPLNTSLPPQADPHGSMTTAWATAAASRMATLMTLLDTAFPGKIAGVHFAGLASGENRYACPPEDYGYADYSAPMADEYCSTVTPRERVSEGGGGGDGDQRTVDDDLLALQHASCDVPTAQDRCTAPSGNLFVSNESARFNLFLSHQVRGAISAHAAAVKTASGGKALVLAFYGYLNELGGHRVAGSGHLELAKLLVDSNIDGIVSPYK